MQLKIAYCDFSKTAEKPPIFEVTIGFYVENWVYKRLQTFSEIRPLHTAVTDTRFCTSKASAPSIASLPDWTRPRACCCRCWAPLLLLLPWPTDTSPLDYVTTRSLLESRYLIIWWCTVSAVQLLAAAA